jgi:hypothetical protein
LASFTRSYVYGSFAISELIAVDYFPFADELIRFEEAAFLADVIPGSPCRSGVLPAPNPPTLTTLNSVADFSSVKALVDSVQEGLHFDRVTPELHRQGMQLLQNE